MNDQIADLPPTSSATTGATEPEVVAGISSGEGSPDIPTNIRVDGGVGSGRALMLLASGAALGFGAARWLRRRR